MDGAIDETTSWSGKNRMKSNRSRQTWSKTYILTDQKGISIGIVLDGANRHDVKLAHATLQCIPISRPKADAYRRQHLCLNAGYVGKIDLMKCFIDAVFARRKNQK